MLAYVPTVKSEVKMWNSWHRGLCNNYWFVNRIVNLTAFTSSLYLFLYNYFFLIIFGKYLRIQIRRRLVAPFPRDSCDFSNGFWSRSPSSGVCAYRLVGNRPSARAVTTAPAPTQRIQPSRPPPPDDDRWTSANHDRGNPTSRRWWPSRVICGPTWIGWCCSDKTGVILCRSSCGLQDVTDMSSRVFVPTTPLARKSKNEYCHKIKKIFKHFTHGQLQLSFTYI